MLTSSIPLKIFCSTARLEYNPIYLYIHKEILLHLAALCRSALLNTVNFFFCFSVLDTVSRFLGPRKNQKVIILPLIIIPSILSMALTNI